MDLIDGRLNPWQVRMHPSKNLMLGSVCGSCNAGWMNNLEGEVRPFLVNLASRQLMPFELSRAERWSLARWALKTALALELATPEHEPRAPLSWLSTLRDGSFPGCIAAYIGAGKTQGIGSVQGVGWWVAHDDDETPVVFPESGYGYKTALHVGAAYIALAEIPDHPYVHMAWRDMHMPLWPPDHITACFSLSPGWFHLAAPRDAIIMYADSLSIATSQRTGHVLSAWAGAMNEPRPTTLTPEQAQEIHRTAAAGPFDVAHCWSGGG